MNDGYAREDGKRSIKITNALEQNQAVDHLNYGNIGFQNNDNRQPSNTLMGDQSRQSYCMMNAANKCDCFIGQQCSASAFSERVPVARNQTFTHTSTASNLNESSLSTYPYQSHWNSSLQSSGGIDRIYTRNNSPCDNSFQTSYYGQRQSANDSLTLAISYDGASENLDASAYQSGSCHRSRGQSNYHDPLLDSSGSTKPEANGQANSISFITPVNQSSGSTNGHDQRSAGRVAKSLGCSKQGQQIASSTIEQQQGERDYHPCELNKSELQSELYQPGATTSTSEQFNGDGGQHVGSFGAVGGPTAENRREISHLGSFRDAQSATNVSANQHNNAIIVDQEDHSNAYHTKASPVQRQQQQQQQQTETRTMRQDSGKRTPEQIVERQHQQFDVNENYYGTDKSSQLDDGAKQINVDGNFSDNRPFPLTKQRQSIGEVSKLTAAMTGADSENHSASTSASSASVSAASLDLKQTRFSSSPRAIQQQSVYYSSYANQTLDGRSAGCGTNQITAIDWPLVADRGPTCAQNLGVKSDQNNNRYHHLKVPNSAEQHSMAPYQQDITASVPTAAAPILLHQPVQKQRLISMNNYHQESMKYEQSCLGVDESVGFSFSQPHPTLERHCVDGSSDYILAQQQQQPHHHHSTSQMMGPSSLPLPLPPSYIVSAEVQSNHRFATTYQRSNPAAYIQASAHHLHPAIY